jgi:glycosyltransferase involved in cell wall biosynthesis
MASMHILIAPFSDSNPYQEQLKQSIEETGNTVSTTGHSVREILGSILAEGMFDVLHFHWISSFIRGKNKYTSLIRGVVFLLILYILKNIGVNIIWTIHNKTGHHSEVENLEKFIYKILISRILQNAIVHSNEAKSEVLSEYNIEGSENKVVVIPHGSFIGYYKNTVSSDEAREHLDLKNDDFIYLFFGKIRPYKNIKHLIKTFKEINQDDIKLVIAGDPALTKLKKDIRKLSKQDDRIRLHLEYIAENDVQYFMNAADVLVLPYEDILTSGTAVLGMSFGKPLIAPNKGCLIDTLPEDSNFKYDGSTEELKSSLRESADSRDINQFGKANLNRVAKWSWNKVAIETIKLYKGNNV